MIADLLQRKPFRHQVARAGMPPIPMSE